jgi:hypothetical protein
VESAECNQRERTFWLPFAPPSARSPSPLSMAISRTPLLATVRRVPPPQLRETAAAIASFTHPPHSPGAEARNKTPARCCLRASESWSPTLPLWCLVAPPFAGKRASHILIRISASFGPSLLVRVNTETPLRGRRRYDMNRTNEKGAPQTGTTTNLLQCRKCRVQVGQQQRQAKVRRTWGTRLPHGSSPRGHLV